MKLRLTYDEAIHKLLQIYQPPPPPVLVEDNVDEASSTLKDSSQPEVINLENEETTSGVTCVESSSLSAGRVGTGEKSVSQASLRAAVCLGEACKKRASNDCIHKMCFLCCYGARKIDGRDCASHRAQTIEREREDRYIEEGMAKKPKKATKLPFFYEEKFSDSEETVVIWCLKDFALNKKWNEESFNQELRRERQKTLLKRRQQFRGGISEDNDSDKAAKRLASLSVQRARRAERYRQIREKWTVFALEK